MTKEEAEIFLYSIAGDLGFTDVENYTCKDGEKMREAIKALEQEPCEDAISRQAVFDLISKFIHEIHTEGGRDLNAHTNDVLRQILRNVGSDRVLPPVNPQEPFKPMVEIDLYSVIKQKYIERDVLDKIRDEIKAEYKLLRDLECTVYDVNTIFVRIFWIIEKYKAESEVEE